MNKLIQTGISVFFGLIIGCGSKKDGESGFAKLSLVHAGGSSLQLNGTPDLYTPSVFGVKLASVRLTPDFDDNQNPQGVSPVIWANAACNLGIQTSVETHGKDKISTEYSSIEGACTDDMISTYFDLSRPTAEVNAELNSQHNKVLPGTYKYVTMEFCENGPKSENAQFMADGMAAPIGVQLGTCGINSVEANPPIVIGEGESATVSVSYSLEDIVYDYGEGMTKSAYCYFSEDGDIRRCVGMPKIVPSFSKE